MRAMSVSTAPAALILATLILAAGGLSACAGPRLTPEQRAEADCAARGGKMQRVGRMQSLQCILVHADADKPCADNRDCVGDCRVPGSVIVEEGRAVEGRCHADSNPFGCYTRVENGRATAAICVD